MGGDKTHPMLWKIIYSMLVLAMMGWAKNSDLCPSECKCNDEELEVSCASASLEVVPIQLNPEVRHIDLSNNKIYNVHFTLSFYNSLVTLNLSNNNIRTLGSGNFISQRGLKQLNLSCNEIQNLGKDALKGLRTVTLLDLSYNRLKELNSPTFRELHSLQTLKLTGNDLMHLEDGLFKSSKHLQQLYLDDNQLLDVPSGALVDAVNLQYLSLSQNLLATINNTEIPNLPDLNTLLLDGNVISDIHDSGLSTLLALNHLDLSDNNFTTVPTEPLEKLASLKKLKFSGNDVKLIPPVAFKGLFQLRYLYLDRLELLEAIDMRAFVDNINLEKVWLDDNIGIERLPTRLFHGNTKIVHISVRNNRLVSLDATHFPLDQLRYLRLGDNPLQCNCSLLWLWQLSQEQKSLGLDIYNESTRNEDTTLSKELLLDVNDIRCAGPEKLVNILLVDAKKSEIDCSVNWLAAISVSASAIFILIIIAAVIYFSYLRTRYKETQESSKGGYGSRTANPSYSNGRDDVHDSVLSDKCIMSPAVVHHDYRSLSSWGVCHTGCTSKNKFYEQLDKNTKARPHIVYV